MALGPFDDFFDMDHDGKLDFFEEGMKFAFYASMAEEAAKDDTDYSFRRRRSRSSYNRESGYECDDPDSDFFEDDEDYSDSSDFSDNQSTPVSFDSDPYGILAASLNKVISTKTFEDAPSDDEKPDVTPSAAVNIPKTENEKSEAQKSKSKKNNSSLQGFNSRFKFSYRCMD